MESVRACVSLAMMEEGDGGRLDLDMDLEDMMGLYLKRIVPTMCKSKWQRGQENGTSITKDGGYSSKERYHRTCQLSFFAFSSG